MFLTRTNWLTRYKTLTNFGLKNQEFATSRWKTAGARHPQISISKVARSYHLTREVFDSGACSPYTCCHPFRATGFRT